VFSDHDVQLIRYAVCDVVARRRLHRNPVPPGMDALEQRLRQPMMSANGHDLGGAPAELKQNTLIGSVEAATLLGCTARHVRRIAADLEGQRVEGVWVFRRQPVVDYANAKGDGCDRD